MVPRASLRRMSTPRATPARRLRPSAVTVVSDATLTQAGSTYDVSTPASDPVLKYKGIDVTAGQFGTWVPIAAVQTATGYDVAWKETNADEYTVWTTDVNGNYTGNLIGAVPEIAPPGNRLSRFSAPPVSPDDDAYPDRRFDQSDRSREPILS